jgi:DNA repair exonuclease SbcCD nuclease subunit
MISFFFFFCRDIEVKDIEGFPCLMMPYFSDQQEILKRIEALEKEKGKDWLSKVIGFGHLSLNGALQNSRSQGAYIGSTSPQSFAGLKRVFSGHFHIFHSLPPNVVYVGAPLQLNFGDAGESRGCVIYEPATDSFQFVANPHSHQFLKLTDKERSAMQQQNPEKFVHFFLFTAHKQFTTYPLPPFLSN